MTCTRKRLIFFSSFIHVPEAYFLRSMHLVAVRTRLHSGDDDKDLHYLVQQSYLYITVCACVFFLWISLFVILIRYEILFFRFSQY